MEQQKLDRINELAHKAKNGGLTPQEEAERARLRAEYIEAYRRSLREQLENTYLVDENGVKHPLRKKQPNPPS